MIHIGIGNGSFDVGKTKNTILQLQRGSKLIFNGKCAIASGAVINNSGTIEFGKNFSANFGLFITCSEKVIFGDECLLGWNNHFLDNSGHVVMDKDKNITSEAHKIEIGNNVWITSETHFMPGASIGSQSVVGYKSFVLKNFFDSSGCLIAGNPAKILRKEITWKK